MTEFMMVNIIFTASLVALGACFGSFINAAALRYGAKVSFVKGRSACPHCKRVLGWFELVPVAGWFLLGGKCRGCKVRIPVRYVLVEILCAALFGAAYGVFGFSLMTVLAISVAGIMLAISLIDINTTEIPDGLTIALIPFAVAAIWLMPDVGIWARVIGFFAISLPMLLLALFIGGAFGGGDIKLMAVCGFLLGWQGVLLAFFVAVVLGGGWAIWLLLTKRRKKGEAMVFGPALCVGVYASLLFGGDIINWYLGFF
ncbi:MAG: prepilin peptidase [Defluviitaleaceae bacterium]|nr:prepilin peptidase [Defluviitaleaceae bacterium]